MVSGSLPPACSKYGISAPLQIKTTSCGAAPFHCSHPLFILNRSHPEKANTRSEDLPMTLSGSKTQSKERKGVDANVGLDFPQEGSVLKGHG